MFNWKAFAVVFAAVASLFYLMIRLGNAQMQPEMIISIVVPAAAAAFLVSEDSNRVMGSEIRRAFRRMMRRWKHLLAVFAIFAASSILLAFAVGSPTIKETAITSLVLGAFVSLISAAQVSTQPIVGNR